MRPNEVNVYDIGDLVTLVAPIVATDGITPAQPSYFAFLVKNPGGSVATYVRSDAAASVGNPTTGLFVKDITVDQVGSWFYRAVATGNAQAAEEWGFMVRPSFVL